MFIELLYAAGPTKDARTAGIFSNILKADEILKRNGFTYVCGYFNRLSDRQVTTFLDSS